MTGEKLRVDMADLTFGELAEAAEMLGAPIADLIGGTGHFRYVAAVVCVTVRRTDPTFTLDQALRMRTSDVELVDSTSDPEASAGSNGAGPALLPASGD